MRSVNLDVSMPLAPGSLFADRFEIEHLAGQGGTGLPIGRASAAPAARSPSS